MKLYYAILHEASAADASTSGRSARLLRAALQAEGVDATRALTLAPGGKPAFADGKPPFFSITHTGEYWLCALSETPVGLDAEKIDRSLHRPDRLASRFFSEAEQRYIEGGSEDTLAPPTAHVTEPAILRARSLGRCTAQAWADAPAELLARRLDFTAPAGALSASDQALLASAASRLLLLWTRKEAYLKYTAEGLRRLDRHTDVLAAQEGCQLTSWLAGPLFLSICVPGPARK